MITDIEGIRVGHWTDPVALTGCTVVLLPDGTVGSGEVRGGAPATREFALLEPSRTVRRIDAVVLTGGSAFGLASADGVMAHLADLGVGFETAGGVVPIVIAMGLYDLGVGDNTVRPGAEQGRSAAASAADGPHDVGLVGAGTGATVAKWQGPDHRRPGGLVAATTRHGELVVSTLIACNAFGDPGRTPGDVVEGTAVGAWTTTEADHDDRSNTTIGVVATNARLDKVGCFLVAQSAHDGLARAVAPAHTAADGDAFVAAATGRVDAEVGVVRNLAVHVVSTALATLAAEPASEQQ